MCAIIQLWQNEEPHLVQRKNHVARTRPRNAWR